MEVFRVDGEFDVDAAVFRFDVLHVHEPPDRALPVVLVPQRVLVEEGLHRLDRVLLHRSGHGFTQAGGFFSISFARKGSAGTALKVAPSSVPAIICGDEMSRLPRASSFSALMFGLT